MVLGRIRTAASRGVMIKQSLVKKRMSPALEALLSFPSSSLKAPAVAGSIMTKPETTKAE